MSARADAIRRAMAQAEYSKTEVEATSKEWALAHDAFNKMVTQNPRKGRNSGTDLQNVWLHATGAYEALLDAMRVHSENLAHLHALKGR